MILSECYPTAACGCRSSCYICTCAATCPHTFFPPSNLLLPSSAAPHTHCTCLIPPSGYLRSYLVAKVKHCTHVSTNTFFYEVLHHSFFCFIPFFALHPSHAFVLWLVLNIFHVTITLSHTQHFLCSCLPVCHTVVILSRGHDVPLRNTL